MELTHDKFEGAKELAEINVKISAGVAALAQMKADEETYFTEREKRLVARLEAALVDSEDLVKAIGENHSSLIGYRNEVSDLHTKLLFLIQGIDECMSLINDTATTLENRITAHEERVSKFISESRSERNQIDSKRAEVNQDREKIVEETRLLDDRKAMLERTLARINQQ